MRAAGTYKLQTPLKVFTIILSNRNKLQSRIKRILTKKNKSIINYDASHHGLDFNEIRQKIYALEEFFQASQPVNWCFK